MPDIYFSGNNNNKNNNNKDKNGSNFDNRKHDDYVYIENREFEDVYSSSSGASKKNPRRPSPPPKKKKRHIFRKVIAVLLIIVLLAGGAGLLAINSLLGDISYQEGEKHENQYISSSKLLSSPNVTNILLIGVDSRDESTDTRSDTMMLVSVNKLTKEIVLTSFMRDLYVEIPDNGHNRLNAANVFGGTELLMDTIEYNYKIQIDNYMLVTFDVFKKLVDGIGGVYVDVSEAEAEYMHGSFVNLPEIKAGSNIHLNGNEALWYCRIRKLDSDFNRTERQREVVKSIISQLVKTSPSKLYSTAKEMMPLIKTDLTKSEITSLASFVPALYTGYDLKSITVPADDTWQYANRSGMSVIVADNSKNTSFLNEQIYKNK